MSASTAKLGASRASGGDRNGFIRLGVEGVEISGSTKTSIAAKPLQHTLNQMGTRGLLGFIIGAQCHATYNHYDSYPEALGKQTVAFLLSLKGREDYKKTAGLWVDERSTPSPELQRKYSKLGFSNLQVSNGRLDDWYCLLHKARRSSAARNPERRFVDFLKDSLFCEWAYFIDFENQIFETWSFGKKLDEVTFRVLVEKGQGYWNTLGEKGEVEDSAAR
ncbi:unnamed protein product [Cyclocybe aegerita]|uniref:Uncharacterized protein n=1 Tax=Cyclocybe aegerita TaxID=1973307 RepID=A0A8S0WHL0_CYCAE|nr:unnamed protein product [Cyclocybe aegerita]